MDGKERSKHENEREGNEGFQGEKRRGRGNGTHRFPTCTYLNAKREIKSNLPCHGYSVQRGLHPAYISGPRDCDR